MTGYVQAYVHQLFKAGNGLRWTAVEIASAFYGVETPSADQIKVVRRAADHVAALHDWDRRMIKGRITYLYSHNRQRAKEFAALSAAVEIRNSCAFEARGAQGGDVLDMLEVRFATPGEDGDFEGMAVRFDTLDSYGSTFDKRAFAWDGKSIPLLWSHDPSAVVGSVRTVRVENNGLKITGKLNLEVQRAREVRSMLLAGDISGLSIGFRRLKQETRAKGVRHITEARINEISLCAVPSVPGSGVTSIRIANHETGRESAAAFVSACRKAALSLKRK